MEGRDFKFPAFKSAQSDNIFVTAALLTATIKALSLLETKLR